MLWLSTYVPCWILHYIRYTLILSILTRFVQMWVLFSSSWNFSKSSKQSTKFHVSKLMMQWLWISTHNFELIAENPENVGNVFWRIYSVSDFFSNQVVALNLAHQYWNYFDVYQYLGSILIISKLSDQTIQLVKNIKLWVYMII